MTYSCAIFSRGATTLEEAQATKLELVCTKLGAAAGRARARRRLRLGQLRDPRGARARRPRHRHHAVGAAGRAARASAPRRPASPTASTSASWTTASSRGEPFDAIATIGMVEHVGSGQHRRLRAHARARCCEPGGRLLNHGIARAAPRRPRGRPVLRALRVPRRRAAAPVADPARARARRASRPTTSRASRADYAETLRALGASASTTNLERGDAARRPGARARLAALPARRAPRLRDRLHVGLPGPRGAAGRRAGARGRRERRRRRGGTRRARSARSRSVAARSRVRPSGSSSGSPTTTTP